MKRTILILGIVLLLAITACTSNDDGAPEVQGQDSTTQTVDTTTTTMTTSTTAVKSGDITSLLSMQPHPYSVTYDTTTTANGQTVNSETTMYMDLPNRIRMDSSNGQVEARTYFVDGTASVCTNGGGSWMCFENPSATPPKDQKEEITTQGYESILVPMADRTIAGQKTSCYKVDTNEADAEYEYCFNSNAVLLYMHSRITNYESTMQATAYTDGVKDSDFKLPA